jgi:hypothetical protein
MMSVVPPKEGPAPGGGDGDPLPPHVALDPKIVVNANGMAVDVAILMDCTGSMGAWIEAAKQSALDAAAKIREGVAGE